MYSVDQLLKHVMRVGEVVNPSALVPIAKTILFGKTDGPNTVLKATDLQTSIVDNVPQLPYIGFDYCVDAQKLIQLLKSLKGQKISLKVENNKFTVISDNGEYVLPYLPGEEFPEVKIVVGENEAPAYAFERALELTKNSVANDELRPIMCGVHFDTELGYVVATNGHMLSRYKADFKGDKFTLPIKAYNLLKGYGDASVYYHVGDNAIHFTIDGGNVDERLQFKITKVEGNYPPYDKVIPTNNPKSFTINQADLLDSLKRVSLFAAQDSNSIELDLGAKKIKGVDVNFGNSAEEGLHISFEEEFSIGLNSKYLIELLNTTGDGQLTFTFSESNKPVLISNSSNPRMLQLVMPIQI